METTMSALEILSSISVLLVIIGSATLIFAGRSTVAFALITLGLLIFSSAYLIELSNVLDKNRSISANEERAIKMFKQNCKQVNFIQANNNTGVGAGLSTDGKPVVGAIQSRNEDSYTYKCDNNIEYTLTYDIEKYRK